jgi:hypothetical protein
VAVTVDDYSEMLDVMEVEAEARSRYSQSQPYQAQLASQYTAFHHYYAPPIYGWGSGDQWPADRTERPGKIHVSLNLMRPTINSSARLEAMLPRITIPSSTLPEDARKRAEGTEQLMMTWLDMSGWDVWMYDLCQVKGIYGKVALKTFWNKADKRGDVSLIEQPWNLRIGWGANDFSVKDWALYEYRLSPQEIRRRYPNLQIKTPMDSRQPLEVFRVGDHTDPLSQNVDNVTYRQESDYEQRQLAVWDYWYRHAETDAICNAILVGGVVAYGPKPHSELYDIPYLVTEHDHEPGNPDGVSSVVDLIDLQIEMNRLFSHGLQYVADNVDPAWYITGDDAAGLPEGIVPKAGEATNLGNSQLLEVPKGGANTFPITEMMSEAWNAWHRISGLPEIGLGGMSSSDISGRAVAVQIQSHANRMDPRRNRVYRTLKELLRSWVFMATKVNPQVDIGPDEQGQPRTAGVADLVKGMTNWKIIAPEITPRDAQESVMTEINLLNAKGQSLRSMMDKVGIENPEAEIEMVKSERMDPALFAADAQAYLGIMTMLQQIQMQQQQMQAQAPTDQPQAGAPGMSAQAQGSTAVNQMQQQAYAAQPTGFEDQNQGGQQPASQAGTPAAPGGPSPNTTLIRGGQALNQIAVG